jgi:hypothetical protein
VAHRKATDSYFVDPRGKILAEGSEDQDELVTAEMDLDVIEEVRRVWQFSIEDRRLTERCPLLNGIVFLIVDGLNLIRRVYAATPLAACHFDSAPGGVQSLRRALTELSPTHAVVVFDGRAWHINADYKADAS